jgi:hypothetical protein
MLDEVLSRSRDLAVHPAARGPGPSDEAGRRSPA